MSLYYSVLYCIQAQGVQLSSVNVWWFPRLGGPEDPRPRWHKVFLSSIFTALWYISSITLLELLLIPGAMPCVILALTARHSLAFPSIP